MNNSPELEIKWRKSAQKEDSLKVAREIQKRLEKGISPYSLEQAQDLVRAGVRSGELELKKKGRTGYLQDPHKWFLNRILPNTVILTWEDYVSSLANSLELVILAEPAKTDFGGARQREFGQQWTDFTRGYLGEVALKKYFLKRFDIQIELKQRETGYGVEKYLPTDVVKIHKNGSWKDVEKTLSIKTSKLGSLWLGIPAGQLPHSDAFTFVKIGVPLDHLTTFLKEISALEELFELADKAKSSEDWKKKQVLETVPSFEPIPAYIPGFAWEKDFKQGELEGNSARKHYHITGGIGKQPEEPPEEMSNVKVKGIGTPNEEYLAACGALREKNSDWNSLIEKM